MVTLEQIAEKLGSQGDILAVSVQGPDNEGETRGIYLMRCSEFDSRPSPGTTPEIIVDSIDLDNGRRSAHVHVFDSSGTRRTPLSIIAPSRGLYLVTSKEGLHIARAYRKASDKDDRSRQVIDFKTKLIETLGIDDTDETYNELCNRLDDFSRSTKDKRTFAALTPLSTFSNVDQYILSLFLESDIKLGHRTEKRLGAVGSFYMRAKANLKDVPLLKQKRADLVFNIKYCDLAPAGVPRLVEDSPNTIKVAMPEGNVLKIFNLENDVYSHVMLNEPQVIRFSENLKNAIVSYDVHGKYAAAVLYDLDAKEPSFTIEVQESGMSGQSRSIRMENKDICGMGHWPRSIKLVEYKGNMYCLVGCDAGMLYTLKCGSNGNLDECLEEVSKFDLLGYRFLKDTAMSRSDDAICVRQISSDYSDNLWVSCYKSIFRMKPDFIINAAGEITGSILKEDWRVRKAVFPHRVMNFAIDTKSE